MILIEVDNPSYSTIRAVGDDPFSFKLLEAFEKHMARYVEGYRFMRAYKMGRWDGKIRFFTKWDGKILTGLVPYAYHWLKAQGEVQFIDHIKQFDDQNVEVDPYIFSDYGYILYDDQKFALDHLLKKKRGIGEIATGAGKTIMTCALFETIQPEHGLVIVPNIDLVIQTYEEGFVEVGLESRTGMFYGSRKDELKQYTVATWQSLNKVPEIMETFDMIIVDECHGAKGNVIQELMSLAINAEIRYGITGTLPKADADYLSVEGALGQKLVEVTPADLQRRGRLTKAVIIAVHFEYPEEFVTKLRNEVKSLKLEGAKKRRYVLERISCYTPRKQAIKKLVESSEGFSVLLTNYIKEGEEISQILPNSVHVDGSMKEDERQKVRSEIKAENIEQLVATYKLAATGLNYKHLKNVFMISPSKSFVSVIQAIGRSLRKHEDKNLAVIFDIDDRLPWIESFDVRHKYYEEKEYPDQEITIAL